MNLTNTLARFFVAASLSLFLTMPLDSLQAAAGKKVAVIGYDKQARVVANVAGASPVPATIASFGPLFNNHSVDMAYAPAIAYKPLELYKGLGENGGRNPNIVKDSHEKSGWTFRAYEPQKPAYQGEDGKGPQTFLDHVARTPTQ